MTLEQIQSAVNAGRKVYWSTMAYEVRKDSRGQWWIVCTANGYTVGLTWADGQTLNGKPEEFFTPPQVGDICKTTNGWAVLVESVDQERVARCFILEAGGNLPKAGSRGDWHVRNLILVSDQAALQCQAQDFAVNRHVSDCGCALCRIVEARWNRETEQ